MPVSSGTAVPPAGQAVSPKSGAYTFLGANASTSATLGVGTLRAAPVYVPKQVTLDRIGAEITAAGDVGSKLRLGIYSDNGNIYPGALLLDAGTINGDSATVQEITISQVLDPGVYWLAGAVQIVTTTQPTVRTALEYPFCPIRSTNAAISWDSTCQIRTGITGALVAAFDEGSINDSSPMPRIFLRAA